MTQKMNYLERAVEISTEPENCEGDNWTDLINLCGEADAEIKRVSGKIKEAIELIQDGKRQIMIHENYVAALSAMNAATDMLANIKEDSITEIVEK